MKRIGLALAVVAIAASASHAQSTDSPYKVLQREKVGEEGGTDYIFADPAGRKIYITRNAVRATPATADQPAHDSVPGRVNVYDIETLKQIGSIINGGGNGAVADSKSGHGFASSHPDVTMFDLKTGQLIKTIPVNEGMPPRPAPQFSPDGIYFDESDGRVYVGSHPTHDLIVIDVKDGKVYGKIPLPGTPEQTVSDGKGMLYALMQDSGSVAVVDEKAMKVTKVFSFQGNTGCNGLAIDPKNHVLFASCGRVGPAVLPAPGTTPPPAQPQMVILSSVDGKIFTKLPLAGSSDGAVFNPKTMEAFSSHGNGTLTVVKEKSPTEFEVEENLETMNGARTLALDTKTGNIFVMSVERGPAPPPPPGGGRGGGAPAIPGSFTIVKVGKP
jgi:DNA-binding beta-propeller fold protein YncE